MLAQIRDLVRSLVMTQTQVPEEVIQNLAKAQADLTAARSRHAAARSEYVADLAAMPEDVVTISRHRKIVAKAEDDVRLAQDRVEALEALREKMAEEHAAADWSRRWKEARRMGGEFVWAIEELEAAERALSDKLDAALALAERFRESLPTKPTAAEEATLLYVPQTLIRRAQVQLFALSAGRFTTRSLTSSPWELAQGPSLGAVARETVGRVMRNAPTDASPVSQEAV